MKQLPLGRQSFEDLSSNGCIYVDKTDIIHRIILNGKVYFLSRPRRFGKSLLVSTMEALFKGQKELFEGLYIYDKWDWTQQYPVIKIDWTLIDHSTPEKMENSLCRYLRNIARKYKITIQGETVPDCFNELITLLNDQSGEKVVVLIDEYDKPVTAHLFDSHLTEIRTAVHDFYQVIKGADEYLKFVFLTGVSKFSGLSIFSALNNLTDISLDERYAAICGYTQEELENNFPEYIDRACEYLKMTREKVLERIRYWYNGYTWDGETAVYNPYSTLNFFNVKRFSNYWFKTGTPTFLINIIQQRDLTDAVLEPIVVGDGIFDGYDPPDISEVPLLFQTGYLTIKQLELLEGIPRYTLGIPNSEVNEGFMTHLLRAYGKYSSLEWVDDLRLTMA
ncbi:MAG: AAA family ATPase, partial [Planctomycetaceae bacterium]|nr:AAA family ATPase [Planctomycetaceae bacterium]